MKFFEVTNTTWENLQIAKHKSVQCAEWTLICALQFADFLRWCLSPRTTSHTISFSISNSFLVLIWFLFSILVQPEYSLCPFLILFCSGMRSFTWTSVRPQLSLFVALAARLWWFTAGCHVKSLSSPHPSQTEVCSTMRESIRPSSFHNPTLSANKHVVQICRFSLSAAVDGLADRAVQVSVEPRLSTATHKAEMALKDRSVVPWSHSLWPSPL